MKFIIEYDGIKRTIDGPFRVCASREDILGFIRCLSDFSDSSSYGWVDVVSFPPPRVPNTEAITWREGVII